MIGLWYIYWKWCKHDGYENEYTLFSWLTFYSFSNSSHVNLSLSFSLLLCFFGIAGFLHSIVWFTRGAASKWIKKYKFNSIFNKYKSLYPHQARTAPLVSSYIILYFLYWKNKIKNSIFSIKRFIHNYGVKYLRVFTSIFEAS